MSPKKQRKIASKGGKAAHKMGTAHEFTHEEAVKAGKKGGKVHSSSKGFGSMSPERQRKIAAKGGRHSHLYVY